MLAFWYSVLSWSEVDIGVMPIYWGVKWLGCSVDRDFYKSNFNHLRGRATSPDFAYTLNNGVFFKRGKARALAFPFFMQRSSSSVLRGLDTEIFWPGRPFEEIELYQHNSRIY